MTGPSECTTPTEARARLAEWEYWIGVQVEARADHAIAPAFIVAVRALRSVVDEADALLAEVDRLGAKPAKVARWESEPGRADETGHLVSAGDGVMWTYYRRDGWWSVFYSGRFVIAFPTEAEARAYIEAEAKRRGWEVRP